MKHLSVFRFFFSFLCCLIIFVLLLFLACILPVLHDTPGGFSGLGVYCRSSTDASHMAAGSTSVLSSFL